VKIPAPAPLMKHTQRTHVSPRPQVSLRVLVCEVGALGVHRGDPPSHWTAQERLTIHMHEALCSQETRPHQA
jgi:hypothetical protein